MDKLLDDLRFEFRRNKDLADRALASLDESQFFRRPDPHVNSVALIVKHLAGNLQSRWTNFLTTDGEKPQRNRDAEFQQSDSDTRDSLLSAWEHGWSTLFHTLETLHDSDLDRTVTIRSEPLTVRQALLRAFAHAAYHTGQITYLTRLLHPDSPWITIPPNQSSTFPGEYRTKSPRTS